MRPPFTRKNAGLNMIYSFRRILHLLRNGFESFDAHSRSKTRQHGRKLAIFIFGTKRSKCRAQTIIVAAFTLFYSFFCRHITKDDSHNAIAIVVKHCRRTMNAITNHFLSGCNSIAIDKALEADFAVSHIKFKIAVFKTIIRTTYEFSHGSHHFFIIFIGTNRRDRIYDILVITDTNQVIDFLNLALQTESELKHASFFVE